MAQNPNKTPFTETQQFEKVSVQPYGGGAYIAVNNGGGRLAEIALTLKQVKALRKNLKDVERRIKSAQRDRGCY